MKKLIVIKYITTCSVIGLLALSSSNLGAAESKDKSKDKEKDKDSQAEQGRPTEASKQELKVSQEQLSKSVTDANKASKIIGMQVKNIQNEDIGKVKDIVFDVQSGKVAYAVISAGGKLMGGNLVAVPFDALSLQPGAKNMVMNISKNDLKNAGGFSDKSWPPLDAVATGKTVGIASQKGETDQSKAAGGTSSGSEKSSGSQSSGSQTNSSSQPSTNQPSASPEEQPKSDK